MTAKKNQKKAAKNVDDVGFAKTADKKPTHKPSVKRGRKGRTS